MKEKYIFLIILFIAVIILLGSLGCEENRTSEGDRLILTQEELVQEDEPRDEAAPGNVYFTKNEIRGMKLFMKACNRCHPAGEKGNGPSLVDKKIPDFAIHFQIRQGLGNMPAFKKDDISKEDVQDIIRFVRILRNTP